MTIEALIVFLGIIVTVLPFLGFPLAIDNVILVALGICVILLGIVVRRRAQRRSSLAARTGTYADSVPRDLSDAHVE